jgi:branched-chain amino acid transport system permease protein
MLDEAVQRWPDQGYAYRKTDAGWVPVSFRQARERAREFAAWLLSNAAHTPDAFVIIGEGSPEWVMGELGLLMAGCVSVPLSVKLLEEEIPFRVNHSKAAGILTSKNQLPKVLGALKADFYLTQLTMSAYYTLVTLGLCLLMGYAGQISLGHAGFFAIGGYTAAVLSTSHAAPWLSIPAAVVLTAVVAVLIGIPVLRLRGHYLAMATLAFGFIVSRVILGTALLGQADGISDVPAYRFFAGLAITGKRSLRLQNFYVAWALVLIGILVAGNLVRSRTGRALRAIHGDEEAAAASGIDVARHKLVTFVLSAVYAGLAGACLTHFNGGIGPGEAGILKSVRYVALVAAGGMSSLWGTLAVSTSLTFLSLRGAFGLYDDAVFGGLLVLIMLFAPNGLFGLFRRRRRGALRRSASPGALR